MSYTPEEDRLYTWHYSRLWGILTKTSNPSGEPFDWDAQKAKFKTALEKAFKRGFPIDYIPPEVGCSLLNMSVKRCGLEKAEDYVKILLDEGADVNVRDTQGWNVLMLASFHTPFTDLELYSRIVEETENINYQDRLSNRALDLVVNSYICNPTAKAAHRDAQLQKMQILLEHDVDVKHTLNLLNIRLNSPVDLPKGNRECIKYLIPILANYTEQKEQLNDKEGAVYYDYEL